MPTNATPKITPLKLTLEEQVGWGMFRYHLESLAVRTLISLTIKPGRKESLHEHFFTHEGK